MDIQLLKFVAADHSAVVNTLAPVFWGIMYAFLLDTCPDGKLLGHRGWISSALVDAAIKVSKVAVPTYSHQLGTRVLRASHPANT